MSDMSTFGNNDSVFSHGENSISMLKRLVEITKEAYKYLPEKDCTVACGTFVDVDTRAFLSAVQHFRESIEAYRDLTEELDEDISKLRKMCEAFAGKCPYRDKYCGGDFEDCVECDYAKKLVVNKDAESLFEQLKEDCEHFRNLAISRNKELEQEREKSTQLEQRIKVLTAERDLAKKLAKQKAEEFKIQLNEKYGTVVDCMELKAKLDKKCREVGELTKELEREHECSNELGKELEQEQKKSTQLEERIKLIKADRDRYFKYLRETHYFDTDIKHMYPKTLIRENDPCNFCGNCRHYAQMGKDDGDFEGICTQHFIKRVDPDDASCEHFKPTYDTRVVIGKPEFPVCEKCNHEDCSNCILYPF